MTNIPELTDDEATALRGRLMHPTLLAQADARITLRGLDDEKVEDGRAALAAYDAAERAKIRVEAMRECEAIAVGQHKHWKTQKVIDRDGYTMRDGMEASSDILDDIRALIAKEQSQP